MGVGGSPFFDAFLEFGGVDGATSATVGEVLGGATRNIKFFGGFGKIASATVGTKFAEVALGSFGGAGTEAGEKAVNSAENSAGHFH